MSALLACDACNAACTHGAVTCIQCSWQCIRTHLLSCRACAQQCTHAGTHVPWACAACSAACTHDGKQSIRKTAFGAIYTRLAASETEDAATIMTEPTALPILDSHLEPRSDDAACRACIAACKTKHQSRFWICRQCATACTHEDRVRPAKRKRVPLDAAAPTSIVAPTPKRVAREVRIGPPGTPTVNEFYEAAKERGPRVGVYPLSSFTQHFAAPTDAETWHKMRRATKTHDKRIPGMPGSVDDTAARGMMKMFVDDMMSVFQQTSYAERIKTVRDVNPLEQPSIPTVSATHHAKYLRPARKSLGERDCMFDARCQCMLIQQNPLSSMLDSGKVKLAFIAREYFQPKEELVPVEERMRWPPRPCLPCMWFSTNMLYVWMQASGTETDVIINTESVIVGEEGEYKASALLNPVPAAVTERMMEVDGAARKRKSAAATKGGGKRRSADTSRPNEANGLRGNVLRWAPSEQLVHAIDPDTDEPCIRLINMIHHEIPAAGANLAIVPDFQQLP